MADERRRGKIQLHASFPAPTVPHRRAEPIPAAAPDGERRQWEPT